MVGNFLNAFLASANGHFSTAPKISAELPFYHRRDFFEASRSNFGKHHSGANRLYEFCVWRSENLRRLDAISLRKDSNPFAQFAPSIAGNHCCEELRVRTDRRPTSFADLP